MNEKTTNGWFDMGVKIAVNSFMISGLLSVVLSLVYWWMVADGLLALSLGIMSAWLLFFGFQMHGTFIHRDRLRSLCFYFMNQFILTMSVKVSIASTLSELYPSLHPRIQRALDEDEGLPAMETLKHLQVMFDFPLYAIFLHMIDIHVHYGGSIIDMTDMLLSRARREEIEWNDKHLLIKKKAGQLSLLWVLNLIMVLFVRYALADVFQSVFSTFLFKGILLMFFLVFVLSMFVFMQQAYGEKIHAIE